MKKIIINSDDFGLNENTNNAVMELIEKNKISSATILVKMGNSKDISQAITCAKNNQKKASFGLHIDLDDFFEFSKNKRYGSDLDDIISNYNDIYKSNEDKIKDDLNAQFAVFEKNGIKISHIDGHHHVHLFPEILEEIIPLMKKYGVNKMRFFDAFYKGNKQLLKAVKNKIHNNKIKIPDNFIGFNGMPDEIKFARFKNHIISKMPDISPPIIESIFLTCYKKDNNNKKYLLNNFSVIKDADRDKIWEILMKVQYKFLFKGGCTEVMVHVGKNIDKDRSHYRQYESLLYSGFFEGIKIINFNNL